MFHQKEKSQKQVLLRKRIWIENLTGYTFLAPNITGFLIFTLLPVLASLFLAFCQWDLNTPPEFVGVKNFIVLFSDTDFWKYFGNTLFFMMAIPVSMATSLALALLVNHKLKGIVFYRTVFFLPVVLPIVAIAILWRWIYNPDFGLLNSLLKGFGIKNPPLWLASIKWAKPAVMIMGIWKGAGYNMLLYLAALQGIPNQLYEATDIDGAGSWNKFRHITFPMLSPTNFFIVVMSVIGGFQIFDQLYVMTEGGPHGATTTIVYYIWQNAFKWSKMGYAAAMSWILFIIIFIITLINWKYGGKKVDTIAN